MYKRVVIGILSLLFVISLTVPAFAEDQEICFELNSQVICTVVPFRDLRYVFPTEPDPEPWQGHDISAISGDLAEAMANPDPTPWLIVDIYGNQAFLLDFEHEVLVNLDVSATR